MNVLNDDEVTGLTAWMDLKNGEVWVEGHHGEEPFSEPLGKLPDTSKLPDGNYPTDAAQGLLASAGLIPDEYTPWIIEPPYSNTAYRNIMRTTFAMNHFNPTEVRHIQRHKTFQGKFFMAYRTQGGTYMIARSPQHREDLPSDIAVVLPYGDQLGCVIPVWPTASPDLIAEIHQAVTGEPAAENGTTAS